MASESEELSTARAKLLEDRNNAVVWQDLVREMSADFPPIPFVGAMFQEVAGLPEWSAFLRDLAQSIGATVDKDNDAAVANIVSRAGRLFLDDAVDAHYGALTLPETLPASLAMIPHIVRDVIVGSTISHEIEAAFAVASSIRLVVPDLSDAGKIPLRASKDDFREPVLVKLRGDVRARGYRVLTWADYQARLNSTPGFPDFVTELARARRPLLFIGMSIQGSPLIEVLPTRAEGMPASYALLDVRRRDGGVMAWLYNKNIRPIWYRPESGELEACLVGLADALREPAIVKPVQWPVPKFFETASAPPPPPPVPASIAPPVDPTPPPEPPPAVPQGLVDALNGNECVAFVGSGLAARAGMPTWRGFVAGLVDEALSLGFMDEGDAKQQRSALSVGDINSVADNAISAFAKDREALLEYYRRASIPKGSVPDAVGLLKNIPFVGMLTTNYDKMLLDALQGVTTTLTPRDGDAMLEAHAKTSQPYLVQLYGDLDRPDTVVTAPAEYQDLVRSNAAFSRFIEGIFFSRTIFFIGASLEGLTDFLGGFRFPSGVPRSHYALVAVQGPSWQAKAQTLKRRYNIEVLSYPESTTFAQFDDFLADLGQKVRALAPPRVDAFAPGEPQLLRIELRNIGPFDALDLDFGKLRTILLGDNGVGKSTILKAIAVAIVGSEGRHYASRILKSGESSGSIRVMTRRNPAGYLAEIQKAGDETDVISRSGRMLETENWIALGFPPLRTTSWKAAQGPQGMGTKRPTAADLLPLLSGDVDVRMDDLKQWLVNTEAAGRDDRTSEVARERAKKVLQTFLDAVGVLAEGLAVTLAEITTDFRVLVRTPDGVVPIESLSQGMTSLLSWIGIVVQRLHEISGDAAAPMHSHALILMDEIDAHMHPAWQQKLLPRLKTLLPNVQIIASTHSPLLVAGLEASEVVRFVRTGGKVTSVEIDKDMTVGRADQILTGDLFGLNSTLALGEEGEAMRRRYEALLAKSARTEPEEKEFAELGEQLVERIPPAIAENKLERRSQELVQAVLTTDFSDARAIGRGLAEKAMAVMHSMGWKEVDLPRDGGDTPSSAR